MLAQGTVIDQKYEIKGTLGSGGFGTVYKATQRQFEREVALKILSTTLLKEPDGVARFEREARAVSALKHKNIVAFYGYGAFEGAPYMVMEFLPGTSLSALLARAGPLAPERALPIARQILEALRAAHMSGTVHRDLKPSNIMIVASPDQKDLVKIIDFGLVKLMPGYGSEGQKLTETGYALGTCHYMAPEQALGMKIDQRADIYSTGCICYQLLTGKPPFDGDNNVAILYQHINDQPAPLSAVIGTSLRSTAISNFVANCMAKDANERYASCTDALADLEKIDKGQYLQLPLVATKSSLSKKSRFAAFKSPLLLVPLCLILGAAATFSALSLKLDLSRKGIETARADFADTLSRASKDIGPNVPELLTIYTSDNERHTLTPTQRYQLLELLSRHYCSENLYHGDDSTSRLRARKFTQESWAMFTDPAITLKVSEYRDPQLANRMIFVGNDAQVMRFYEGILKENLHLPHCEVACAVLAELYARKGNLARSEQLAADAISLSAGTGLSNFKARCLLGEMLCLDGKVAQADRALRAAWGVDYTFAGGMRRGLGDRARVELLKGAYEQSIQYAQQAQRQAPEAELDATSFILQIAANAALNRRKEVGRLVTELERAGKILGYQSLVLRKFDHGLARKHLSAHGMQAEIERLGKLDPYSMFWPI